MLPNLGQGGCQAIEDAAALARSLRTGAKVSDALRAPTSTRGSREPDDVARQSRRMSAVAHHATRPPSRSATSPCASRRPGHAPAPRPARRAPAASGLSGRQSMTGLQPPAVAVSGGRSSACSSRRRFSSVQYQGSPSRRGASAVGVPAKERGPVWPLSVHHHLSGDSGCCPRTEAGPSWTVVLAGVGAAAIALMLGLYEPGAWAYRRGAAGGWRWPVRLDHGLLRGLRRDRVGAPLFSPLLIVAGFVNFLATLS